MPALQHLARIARAKAGRWTVECPVCRGRFRSFQPAGRIPRSNAECPQCGALERHRLQWLFLQARTDLFTGSKRVLHVAAEPCFARRLGDRPGTHYITADRAASGADVCVDLTGVAFADDSFDVILCSHVLEHIPDDASAMSGLFHVLRPGGWAMVQVPLDETREHTFEDPAVTDPAERDRLFGQWDHVRIYGRDYADRLTRAGFEVHVDRFAFELDARLVARCALLPEPIFVCRKPPGTG